MIKTLPIILLTFFYALTDVRAGGIAPSGLWNQITSLKVKQVSLGLSHTCAILDDSNLKCWGENEDGQLGLGNTTDVGTTAASMKSLKNVDVGTGRKVLQVATGLAHTCVLLDNYKVKCWGYNGIGQLGLGDMITRGDSANQMGDNLPYVNLGTNRTAVQVAVGDTHTCVLMDNSQVKCFGYNEDGMLGTGDTVTNYGDVPARTGDGIPNVALGTNRKAIRLSLGHFVSCALLDDSTVKCWGTNTNGQLGQGDTSPRGAAASQLGDNLVAIDLGSSSTTNLRRALQVQTYGGAVCALLETSQVKCWGLNGQGQLGVGSQTDSGSSTGQMGNNLAAVNLGTNRSAIQITTGSAHACALLDDSTVKCWGQNNAGQLGAGVSTAALGVGSGQMGDTLLPISLGTNRKVIQIAAGGYSTCAVLDNGSLKCWGYNASGQLGLGTTANRGTSAAQMGDSLPIVYLGKNNSRLLKIKTSPLDRTDQNFNKKIGLGQLHACAILTDSSVKCWGNNNEYAIGIGKLNTVVATVGGNANEMSDNLPRVNLGTNKYALQVVAGDKSSCALLDDSGVKCWGSNASGQLGQNNKVTLGTDPSEMGDNLPYVNLGILTGTIKRRVRQIALGGKHVCAIMADNSKVKCWGDSSSGELGLNYSGSNAGDAAGEMGDSLPEVNIGTDRTAVQIVAGLSHTCVLMDNRNVMCWGSNADAQIGADVTTSMLLVPTAVNLGTNRIALQLSAGDRITCALMDNYKVKCWGNGDNGALAQGNAYPKGSGTTNSLMSSIVDINLGTNLRALQITSGKEFTCALMENATVKCWGSNLNGELGRGDATTIVGTSAAQLGDSLLPVDLGTGKIPVQVMAGRYFSCAIFHDSTIKCWGKNDNGQLGQGVTTIIGNAANQMGNFLPVVSLGTGR